MTRSYKCDVCGKYYDGTPAAEVWFDPDARAHSGRLIWSGEGNAEWPRREIEAELCPEHAIALADAVNSMVDGFEEAADSE